jgi:hypothetical protein
MSLAFMIGGNVQRHWGQVLGLCIGIYIVVKGAIAREWTVIPRRSSAEPFKFTPQWYHRLLMAFMGACTAVLSLWSLLK